MSHLRTAWLGALGPPWDSPGSPVRSALVTPLPATLAPRPQRSLQRRLPRGRHYLLCCSVLCGFGLKVLNKRQETPSPLQGRSFFSGSCFLSKGSQQTHLRK
uniref:Uncharacterized protein n=1 Tax=Knipowitschia caucasica TaxID=637954 RepID=A0AAV2KDF8_KNICA